MELLVRKNNPSKLTKHHKIPVSKHGGGGDNISFVPRKLHEAYHTLFINYDPYRIAQILNEMFIDPHYRMRVERIT